VTRNSRWGQGYGLGPRPGHLLRIDQRDNHAWILTETHVFSPAVINEFKGSAARQDLLQSIGYGGDWPRKLGYEHHPSDMFQAVTIDGVLQIGPTVLLRAPGAAQRQVADTLTG
jgi:hypothetical protein